MVPFLDKVNFPVVCCNINTSREEMLNGVKNLHTSYVININGTDIGVIGYITPKTKVSYSTPSIHLILTLDKKNVLTE